MRSVFILGLFAAQALTAAAADAPPAEAFHVFPSAATEAPVITPYLRYQTEMAWQEDDQRRKAWEGIRTEQDLLRVRRALEEHLLAMLGGLPTQQTPLHPQITGQIRMDGFHIEKLIFESLPGVYVSALVYVPDDGNKTHPAVLVPSGHAASAD